MKVITATTLGDKILKVAKRMDCENIAKAKQGKSSDSVDDAIFELMFIRNFLPFWGKKKLKQKECYIKNKFNV